MIPDSVKDEVCMILEFCEFLASFALLAPEDKYDVVFSDMISRKIHKLLPDFEYYDPDASYEEDYMAFINALKHYVETKF
jgi:hypothetical protein